MVFQKILVPVSGKHHLSRAMRVLEQTLQIVRKDGEICFLHCIDIVSPLIAGKAHELLIGEASAGVEKKLNPLVEHTENAGIKWSIHILMGSPTAHIPRFVADNKCDIVVMCTDDGDAPEARSIGSIAERVFQNLNVPLLILH